MGQTDLKMSNWLKFNPSVLFNKLLCSHCKVETNYLAANEAT